MAITNNPIHNTNTTALQGQNAENTAAPQQNNGVVERGVGMLQKVWLQLRGQAGDRHTQQLTNLKAQVKHEFGQDGLQALNNKISAKNWDSPNSTKLFSSSELKNLRSEAFVGAKDIRLGRKLEAIADTTQAITTQDEATTALEVAAQHGRILLDLQSNLDKRDKYPEANNVINDSDRWVGNQQEELELIDSIAHYADPDEPAEANMFSELRPLATSILNTNAPWADRISTNDRNEIEAADDAMVKAEENENNDLENTNDYDKRMAARQFMNILAVVKPIISNTYYEQYLSNNETFSDAVNTDATQIVDNKPR